MNTHARPRRAFALIEALFVLAVVAMLAAFALTSLSRAGRLAQESGSLANLRRIGAMTGHYLADFDGLLPTLSWTKANHPQYLDDVEASAGQVADLVRRRSPLSTFPRPSAFFAYCLYSPIVLADHAGLALPDQLFASPGDTLRLQWQSTLIGPADNPNFQRFVFSSSYECTTAAYYAGPSRSGGQLFNSSSQGVFSSSAGTSGPSILGPQPSSAVRFPSQKTHFYETVSRYSGTRPVFFGFPEARVPMLMMDGSAAVRRSGDAARGAYTSLTGTALDATVDYVPYAPFGDPPVPEGLIAQIDGRLRWTHRLLLGRDFGPGIP